MAVSGTGAAVGVLLIFTIGEVGVVVLAKWYPPVKPVETGTGCPTIGSVVVTGP